LTIPLVRHLASNNIKTGRFGRIGKVYRRETISKKKKRLREFYQADFDIVGEKDYINSEFDIFTMIDNVMKILKLDYQIEYNYRENLEYYLKLANIEHSFFKSVCSSLDKIDKIGYDKVKVELASKGISEEKINLLFQSIYTKLMNPDIKTENDKLIEVLTIANIQNIIFNPSLARGGEYYTGIIFEVKIKGYDSSVIGGGRYSSMELCKKPLDIVGFSFGIDRLLEIFEYKIPNQKSIYISQTGYIDNLLETKIKLINMFKNCKLCYKLMSSKLEIVESVNLECDYLIIIAEKEFEDNKVIVKNLQTTKQTLCELNLEGLKKVIPNSYF
jgi:histidyl-tRNA synthetase